MALFEAIEKLSASMELPRAELAKILNTSIRTVARMKETKKKLHPQISNNLYRAANVFLHAISVLESREKALSWIKNPNRALGGARPIDKLDTDFGIRQVEDVLYSIEYGFFG